MANDDVHTGILLCSSCQRRYPIENSIPNFLMASNDLPSGEIHKKVRQANALVYDSKANGYLPENVQGFSPTELHTKLDNLSMGARKGRLLDLGCGTGLVASLAQSLFQQIVGIDVSANMLRQVASPMDLVQGDICQLPFKKESFDCLTAVAVLHHVYDTSCLLRESFRVLKPGGYLYTDIDHNWRLFYIYGLVMRAEQALGIHLLPDRDMSRGYDSSTSKVSKEVVALAEYHQCQDLGFDPFLICQSAQRLGFSSTRIEWKASRNSNLTMLERILNRILDLLSHTPLARYTSSHFSIVAIK